MTDQLTHAIRLTYKSHKLNNPWAGSDKMVLTNYIYKLYITHEMAITNTNGKNCDNHNNIH